MRSDNLQMQPQLHLSLPPPSAPAPWTSAASAPATRPSGSVFRTRYPSACKECRRRKQKCSLTQPCTNCARRFPQPSCEYGVEKPKRSTYAPALDARDHVAQAGGGLYSHLDMETVHDALLQVEGLSDASSPDSVGSFSLFGTSPPSPNQLFLMSGEQREAEQFIRLRFRDKTGRLTGQDIIDLLQFILKTRLKVTNTIVQDEWQIDGDHLIRAISEARPPGRALAKFDDEIRYLPMEPTKMNKELVRIHLQLMSRFKASLDGSPLPNNRFMKHWIPVSIQDPLVLHVVLCTTASFLNETGRVPKVMMLIHRATAMKMLNEYVGDARLCTSDSAMLAVAQSILTSWYWGSTVELHAHMAGFKRMIEIKGGMQNLGMEGYTSKISLIDDFVIALSHETEPVLFGRPGFEFEDPFRVPLQVNFNSPLLFDCPPFLSRASPLGLHPHTAHILDEMRALHRAVVDLPEHAGGPQLANIYRAAEKAMAAISYVPEDVALAESEQQAGRPVPVLGSGGGGLKRKRDVDDTQEPRKAGTTESSGRAATAEERPDLVHRCVRVTALAYCRAVLQRVPTSIACSEADFLQIWGWAWGAGLDRWAELCGIFVWMMIALVPSSLDTMHSRMTRTLTVTGFMYLGTENWHVAADIARAGLQMQRWLRGGRRSTENGEVSAAYGGEIVVERHGFEFKDAMPEVVPMGEEPEHESESDLGQ